MHALTQGWLGQGLVGGRGAEAALCSVEGLLQVTSYEGFCGASGGSWEGSGRQAGCTVIVKAAVWAHTGARTIKNLEPDVLGYTMEASGRREKSSDQNLKTRVNF